MEIIKCPFCGGETAIKSRKAQTHDAAGAVKKWNRMVNADE